MLVLIASLIPLGIFAQSDPGSANITNTNLALDVKGSEQRICLYAEDFTSTDWWMLPGHNLTLADIVVKDPTGANPFGGNYEDTVKTQGTTDNVSCITVQAMKPGDVHVYVQVTGGTYDGQTFHIEKKWGDLNSTYLDVEGRSTLPTTVVHEKTLPPFDPDETELYTENVTDWVYAKFPLLENPMLVGHAVVHWFMLEKTDANESFVEGLMDHLIATGGGTTDDYWSVYGKYDVQALRDTYGYNATFYATGVSPFKVLYDYTYGSSGPNDPAQPAHAPAFAKWINMNPTGNAGVALTAYLEPASGWYGHNQTEDSAPGDVIGRSMATLQVDPNLLTLDEEAGIIAVALVSYPGGATLEQDPFNGENIICLEKGNKTFEKKSRYITDIKSPQVRWAGEKIVLEKDWMSMMYQGTNYVAIYHMDEESIGTLYSAGENPSQERAGGDIWVLCNDSWGTTSEVILESQFQGKADVEVSLYEVNTETPGVWIPSGPPLVNTGYMVYYLALEDVTLAPDITPDTYYTDLEPDEDSASIAVRVRGWFTSAQLPGTSRAAVDANSDGIYERPAGRYVLPDDWAALAGSYTTRPNWDLMDMANYDAIVGNTELGPFDSGVVTASPATEAESPTIGPFNTLQHWSTSDLWISEATVPADASVAPSTTLPRDDADPDLRNTVVPDGNLNSWDCPMPQALVRFVRTSDEGDLAGLDKGTLEGYGIVGTLYQSPFYSAEIPSHELITNSGYNWNSWGFGLATGSSVDGPYGFWTDLGKISVCANNDENPVNPADVEVYCDNHGIAAVSIDPLVEEGSVTITATADFPNCLKKGQYSAVTSEGITATWGQPTECQEPVPIEDGLSLAGILDKVEVVYTYEDEVWKVWNPSWPSDANTLTELKRLQGYWLRVSEACTLDYYGETISLNAVWNLKGWPGCPR